MFSLREQKHILNKYQVHVQIIHPFTCYERYWVKNMNARTTKPGADFAPHLPALALDALRRTTGIRGHVREYEPWAKVPGRPDARIDLELNGLRIPYAAEIKNVDRIATLGYVKNQLAQYPEPGMLIANRLTPALAHECREANIQFIDAAGNAYLQGQGFFVFVTGQQQAAETAAMIPKVGRAGTPTALRMIFTLLCQPDFLNAPYREIKEAAGIALGTVGWIFNDLTERGLVTVGNNQQARRLLEPQRLIEEWVTNYPLKLRPKLHPMRFKAPTPDWWKQVDPRKYGAQWGGEVAADMLTGHLKPATFTLYLRPENGRKNLTRLVAEHRLRPDPRGDIEILDTFWRLPQELARDDTVPPLLVYADLLATLDPRNLEAAKLIKERGLCHAIR